MLQLDPKSVKIPVVFTTKKNNVLAPPLPPLPNEFELYVQHQPIQIYKLCCAQHIWLKIQI